jgi:HEAT repeat protein
MAQEDEIHKLLEEGFDAFQRGKYEQAYVKLESALQKDPSPELLYAWIEKIGRDQILKMMWSKNENLRNTALRILEASKPRKTDYIKIEIDKLPKYLEDLRSEDTNTFYLASFHLTRIGSLAAKDLIRFLAEPGSELVRSRAISVLVKIGREIVPALTQTLKAESELLRQNAAITLGHIGDRRAIAALKRIMERDKSKEVKKVARESLGKILNPIKKELNLADLKGASHYYIDLAKQYIEHHPSVIPATQRNYLLWEWDTTRQELIQREVPGVVYYELLAQQASLDCLELVEGDQTAWALLVYSTIAQETKASAALAACEEGVRKGLLDPKDAESLKQYVESLDQAKIQVRTAGKSSLYKALDLALQLKQSMVAEQCLDLLREFACARELPPPVGPQDITPEIRRKYFGYPLIKALTYPEKRVRYLAAEVMTRLNPKQKKLGMELVMPNLLDAIREESIRIALIIHPAEKESDQAWINNFKRMLVEMNLHTVVATKGKEGVARSKQYPPKDLIFLYSDLANQTYFIEDLGRGQAVETVLDALKSDLRTSGIPIYMICKDQQDLNQQQSIYEGKIQQYILHSIDRDTLSALLKDTFKEDKVPRIKAEKMARRAIDALTTLSAHNTLYPYLEAARALIEFLNPDVPKDNSLRLPAIQALGQFETPQALGVLTKLLLDPSPDIHIASLKAIARIMRASPQTPSRELLDALKKGLKHQDIQVQKLSAEILGHAILAPKQRLEFQRGNR